MIWNDRIWNAFAASESQPNRISVSLREIRRANSSRPSLASCWTDHRWGICSRSVPKFSIKTFFFGIFEIPTFFLSLRLCVRNCLEERLTDDLLVVAWDLSFGLSVSLIVRVSYLKSHSQRVSYSESHSQSHNQSRFLSCKNDTIRRLTKCLSDMLPRCSERESQV